MRRCLIASDRGADNAQGDECGPHAKYKRLLNALLKLSSATPLRKCTQMFVFSAHACTILPAWRGMWNDLILFSQ